MIALALAAAISVQGCRLAIEVTDNAIGKKTYIYQCGSAFVESDKPPAPKAVKTASATVRRRMTKD